MVSNFLFSCHGNQSYAQNGILWTTLVRIHSRDISANIHQHLPCGSGEDVTSTNYWHWMTEGGISIVYHDLHSNKLKTMYNTLTSDNWLYFLIRQTLFQQYLLPAQLFSHPLVVFETLVLQLASMNVMV